MAAVPVTTCQFENNTGVTFKLEGEMFWHGTGTPPQTIGANGRFTHTGDENGSVGGLLYTLGDQGFAKWIVAWSNKSGVAENKVYTAVLGGREPVIWEDVYSILVTNGKPSSKGHGYESELKIDLDTIFPNLVSSFTKAPAASA